MKDLLIKLIKFPSVSADVKELNNIITFVENYFKNTNGIIEKYSYNQKPSIVIKNFDGNEADIILNGHLDVVPPSEDGQFTPYEKEGKLYGRGAGDMKAGVAIIMKLMKEILTSNYKGKKIILILTTDEEIGGFNGVGKLANIYKGKIVLIPDSGNLKKIVYAEKGIINLELKFFGISSHASRPWLGENAIDNLLRFYNLLKLYIEDTKKLYTGTHWGNSVSLNYVKGGKATNVIPDEVEGKIDIRFTEEFNLDILNKIINKFLLQTNGKIINKIEGNILHTDSSNKLIKKYLNISKNIVGESILEKEHGASDGRFFSEQGAVVLLHRPGCGNLHGKKEYVILSELDKIFDIYKNFIFNESLKI